MTWETLQMESKNYVLVTRNNMGGWVGKVNLNADLDFCKCVLQAMMKSSKSVVRGEILEGDRDYIGDFRVKPLLKVRLNNDGTIVEDNQN
jgi:hypothetical protein